MTWVAWRQYRTELLIALAILVAMSAYLVPTGVDKLAEFRDGGLESCLDAGGSCGELRDRFTNSYGSLSGIVGWFHLAPAIAGLLLAAPLVMDLEHRTYRLAWTQSVSREHWLAMKLGFAIAGVIVFSLLLTLLMTWWYTPLDRSATYAGKDLGDSYGFEGLMPLSYTMFALALALAAGAVSRRILAAIPVALAGFIALRIGMEILLRQGLSSEVSFEAPAGQLALGEATRDMSRFWTVQAIEAAIFFSLAAILLGVTVWAVKRRQ